MKHVFFLAIAVLLVSCSKDKTYTIDGAVYAGGNFEGEMVYLVPFFSDTNLPSDSATIQNSRFHFEGEVDESQVYVLRFRPMMELFLDKLVIIKEPGRIWTVLNRPSTAEGTPLNDSLQAWREVQVGVNQQLSALSKAMKRADIIEYEQMRAKIDSIKTDFDRYNRAVVERNNNAFGAYVDKFSR